ncbi:MAG: DUF4845 domain-containing protein [Gammaproteobacteria bacterium]|nr:MAG: DUF4845 domain-containing protein [Gammaproteobacteria bacterium]
MRHSQQGMSTYTMAVFVLLIVFAGLFAFRVGMPILDNWTVKEVLESIAKDPNAKDMSSDEIRNILDKKFNVNQISHVNVKEHVKIKNENGKRWIIVNYEARQPMFGNIDVVVRFEENRVAIGGSN